MKPALRSLLLLICMLTSFSFQMQAQQKPKPVLKPPVLKSFWGQTNGGTLPLDMALQLVDSSIWVISDKKERMQIARFFLAYKSMDTYETKKPENSKSGRTPMVHRYATKTNYPKTGESQSMSL